MSAKLVFATVFLGFMSQVCFAQSRVKDIAYVEAARDNMLVGFGLVVGLNGTGDGLRNTPVTEQSLKSMFNKLGIATGERELRSKNVAAVLVSGKLPAFARIGTRIDVTISSVGDATSLKGGTLVVTPLRDASGDIMAAAQGQVLVSGLSAQGAAETVTQGTPTAGRVPSGGIVERNVVGKLGDISHLYMRLRNPDFSTAISLTDAVNTFSREAFGTDVARELDLSTVLLTRPKGISSARFIAQIEGLSVETDQVARVILDERSGTVVIGEKVRVSTVAISHGTLTVRVTEDPKIVQPNPFSAGVTAVQDQTDILVNEPDGRLARIRGTTLQDLVTGLNRLGVKPSDVIAILQAIKTAGALQAELVVQ